MFIKWQTPKDFFCSQQYFFKKMFCLSRGYYTFLASFVKQFCWLFIFLFNILSLIFKGKAFRENKLLCNFVCFVENVSTLPISQWWINYKSMEVEIISLYSQLTMANLK